MFIFFVVSPHSERQLFVCIVCCFGVCICKRSGRNVVELPLSPDRFMFPLAHTDGVFVVVGSSSSSNFMDSSHAHTRTHVYIHPHFLMHTHLNIPTGFDWLISSHFLGTFSKHKLKTRRPIRGGIGGQKADKQATHKTDHINRRSDALETDTK